MKALKFIAKLLMVIGALNWGLVGFFGYDLVGDVLGGMDSALARIVFALVGLAGLYGLVMLFKCCCSCGPSCGCHHKK